MDYKRLFSQAEIEELLAWFEAHEANLPASLTVDNGSTHIKDLKRTVALYRDIVSHHRENPTYSGQIFTLEKIRRAIEQGAAET